MQSYLRLYLYIKYQNYLTGVFHNCFKLIYAKLNEKNKFCEFYGCLKWMIQAHLHVDFFTIFFTKHVLFKRFYLYMKLLQSSSIFKQRNNNKFLATKIFA